MVLHFFLFLHLIKSFLFYYLLINVRQSLESYNTWLFIGKFCKSWTFLSALLRLKSALFIEPLFLLRWRWYFLFYSTFSMMGKVVIIKKIYHDKLTYWIKLYLIKLKIGCVLLYYITTLFYLGKWYGSYIFYHPLNNNRLIKF